MNLASGIAAIGLIGVGLFYANMQRTNIKDLRGRQSTKDQETDMRNFLLANIDCQNTAQGGCANTSPTPVQAMSQNNAVLVPRNGKIIKLGGVNYTVRAYCEKKGSGFRVTATHTPPQGTPIPTFGNLGLGLECGQAASSGTSGVAGSSGVGASAGPAAGVGSSSSSAGGGSGSGTSGSGGGSVGTGAAGSGGSDGTSSSVGSSSGGDSGTGSGTSGTGGGTPPSCFGGGGFYDPNQVITFEINPATNAPFFNPAVGGTDGVRISVPASTTTFPSDTTINPFASFGIAFRNAGDHMSVTWGTNLDATPRDTCGMNNNFRQRNGAYTSDSQCGQDQPNILRSNLAQNYFLTDSRFNPNYILNLDFDIIYAADSRAASGDVIDLDAWEHMTISAFSDYNAENSVDTTMVYTFYDGIRRVEGPAARNTMNCRDCDKRRPRDSGRIIHFQITSGTPFKMLRFHGYKGPTRRMEDGSRTDNYGIGFDNFSPSQACPPGAG